MSYCLIGKCLAVCGCIVMIEQFVKAGDLVFDIGANDGTFARACAALGCRVLAVEPQHSHLEDLTGIPGVTPVIAAVGDSYGFADLYLSHNSKWSSLHPEWVTGHDRQATPASQHVEIVTLDGLVAEFGAPDFLKIDTEGHEADVLRGLSQPVPALSFEYHGGAYPIKLDTDPLYDCLMMLDGYEFRAAQHETAWVTDWLTADALMAVMPHLTWGDVYARAVGP
jgi:FkbM family methyltransferase